MRVLLCLSGLALLWLVVFAGPHKDKGKKHDHKDGHEKKGDHQNHDHHQHHDHHHDHHKVSDSNTKFAFDLYRQVAADHPEDNIALSPISISTALAFVSLGAKNKTHDQILEGIGFNISETREKEIHDAFHHLLDELNADDRELQLDSGNGLFIGQTWKILNDFLEKAKNYRSEAFTVNFEDNEEVKEQINSYTEKKTRGKLVDVLSSVDKQAALILVNFMCFRGLGIL
ncbi:alpha-1-antiproteinase 2-like isoform X1 [Pyxicephalus adspersus]|uniref:alpha-1-antiproteinase 2-like isoform X1 n=1 Tax=Pyxicephalus adspersus TaxID=30357 RepID=UPI003B5C7903